MGVVGGKCGGYVVIINGVNKGVGGYWGKIVHWGGGWGRGMVVFAWFGFRGFWGSGFSTDFSAHGCDPL